MAAPTMEIEDITARAMWERVRANPNRARFGFGDRVAVVNVDVQEAYTRPALFPKTAYVTAPDQVAHINALSRAARAAGMPVVWTRVAYKADGGDAGVWGTRTDTPDSLQNIRAGSQRHAFDRDAEIDPAVDLTFDKRMPSAFHETPLQSYLVWHKVDTVVITGGSTSGCIRATAVEALSRGYLAIVPIQCVADRH